MEPKVQMVAENCAMVKLEDGTEISLLVQDGKIVFNSVEGGYLTYHREYNPVTGVVSIHYKYR